MAREPGYRSKISVVSHSDGVDPVGACVGPRGSRVRMVVSELRGEKIDIIPFDEEPARFVAKSLSPARVREVILDDEQREATVVVPDDQLSLAIGKDGQNARLANRLTGWKIDIKSETEMNDDDTVYAPTEAGAAGGRRSLPRADCGRQAMPQRGACRAVYTAACRTSGTRWWPSLSGNASGAGCRGPQSGFLRLMVDSKTSPARVVVAGKGEQKGRGAYLCRRRACLDRALQRKAFQRAFRASVVVIEEEIAAALTIGVEE